MEQVLRGSVCGFHSLSTCYLSTCYLQTMFDLPAYLDRIGLPAPVTPDAEGLQRLQRAHRLAIPFESLDIPLGRPIAIDTGSVFAKLVTARRGGFCFEHNRLFGDALAAIGFTTRPLLARVWLGAEDVPPLTHCLSLVTIDGQAWIADAGFGGSYVPVLPLVEGAAAVASDGARFRLGREATYGWLLDREGQAGTTDGRAAGPGPQPQFSFTLATVFDADLALGSHWAATHSDSRFVRHRVVTLILPRGFASLIDRHYRHRAEDEEDAGEIADPEVYRQRLRLTFGIDLSAEEVAALGLY